MRRHPAIGVLAAVVLASPAGAFTGTVSGVVDGDTIKVR